MMIFMRYSIVRAQWKFETFKLQHRNEPSPSPSAIYALREAMTLSASMTPPRFPRRSISIGRNRNENQNNSFRFHSALLFLLLSTLQTQSASAYADWLNCDVEFDDEEEAIMHRPIVRVEDQSQEKQAYIEIQPHASPKRAPWMASTQQKHEDLFPPSIDNATATTTTTTTTTTLLKLRLGVPPSVRHKNVQFVVHATGEGVSFVGKGVMCDGIRAFSQQQGNHVLLQIHSTRATATATPFHATADKKEIETAGDEPPPTISTDIELVAGWAAGYEAVKLTPRLTISRRNGPGYASNDVDRKREGDSNSEL